MITRLKTKLIPFIPLLFLSVSACLQDNKSIFSPYDNDGSKAREYERQQRWNNRAILVLGVPDSSSVMGAVTTFAGARANLQVLEVNDFESQPINSLNRRSFILRNNGKGPATDIASTVPPAPFSYNGGTFPGFEGTCGKTLPADEECTLDLVFQPTELTEKTTSLAINYNSGYELTAVGTQMRGSGNGLAGVRLTPPNPLASSLNLGVVASSSVQTATFTAWVSGSRSAEAPVIISTTGATVVSSTCSAIMVSPSSCTITLNFTAPATPGVYSHDLKMEYNDGAISNASSIVVNYEVIPAPPAPPTVASLTVSPNPFTFSKILVNSLAEPSSIEQTFVVTNTGDQDATNLAFAALPLTSPGNRFSYVASAATNNCANVTALAKAATCEFKLKFSADVVNTFTYSPTINYRNGAANVSTTYTVTGSTGNPASLSVSPAASKDFPGVSLNRSVTQTFTLANAATNIAAAVNAQSLGALTLGGTPSGTTSPFTITAPCGSSIAPGGSCNLTVSYRPTSNPAHLQQAAQKVAVPYLPKPAATPSTLELSLTGTGTLTGYLNASATTLAFGTHLYGAAAKVMTVPLTYAGVDPVTVNVTSNSTMFVVSGSYPQAVSAAHTISVGYTPESVNPSPAAAHSGSLTITYSNSTGTASQIIAMSGRGGAPATLTISPTTYDFGKVAVGADLTKTYTITNSGSVAASSFTRALSTVAGFSIASTTCTTSLAAAASCNVVVRYRPTVAAVTATATLSVGFHNGVATESSPPSATVSGAAEDRALLSSTPASLNFGKVRVGQTAAAPLTAEIANLGTATATSLNVTAGPDFTMSANDCTSTLAPNARCQVTLVFSPSYPGNRGFNLVVSYNNGAATSPLQSVSVAVAGVGTIPMKVAAGGEHSCILTDKAEVKCAGNNNYAQLGTGDTLNRGHNASAPSIPKAVNFGTNRYAVDITAGYAHTCMLSNAGQVLCWGKNDMGQLGLGSSAAFVGGTPSELGAALPAVNLGESSPGVPYVASQISAGYAHTCALLTGGVVKCWGANGSGQLGQGDTVWRGIDSQDMGDNLTPIPLPGAAVQVAADTAHTSILLATGQIVAVGENFYGQLGTGHRRSIGVNNTEPLVAVNLGTGRTATSISVGGAITSAVLDNGTSKIWGLNARGSPLALLGTLGRNVCRSPVNGTTGTCGTGGFTATLDGYGYQAEAMGDHNPAINLGTGFTVAKISSGGFHSCVLSTAGAVKCFGNASYGQLGLGSQVSRGVVSGDMGSALPAVDFGAGRTVKQLSSGHFHSCALLDDDSVKCWGHNAYGQLGVRDTANRGSASGQMGGSLPAFYYVY